MAGRLLRLAAGLLPAGRREWGQAMRAELAQIEPGPPRLWFALSCLRGSLTQPGLISTAGYPLLMLGVIIGVVAWTGRVTYVPLRAALIGLVVILVALSWLARRPGPLGPVSPSRAARLVRSGGYGLVGAAVLVIVHSLRLADGDLAAKARIEVPACAAVLAIYTVAFVTTTARRFAASTPVLAVGGGCGLAAAAWWLVPVLARPPVPVSSAGGLAAVAMAALAAAVIIVTAASCAGTLAALRHSGRARPDPSGVLRRAAIAGLCAATAAALLIFVAADGLLQFFPHWVASASPPNAPAADRLANSRDADEDAWFLVLYIGFLLAVTLSSAAVVTRRPGPAAPRSASPGPPGPAAVC